MASPGEVVARPTAIKRNKSSDYESRPLAEAKLGESGTVSVLKFPKLTARLGIPDFSIQRKLLKGLTPRVGRSSSWESNDGKASAVVSQGEEASSNLALQGGKIRQEEAIRSAEFSPRMEEMIKLIAGVNARSSLQPGSAFKSSVVSHSALERNHKRPPRKRKLIEVKPDSQQLSSIYTLLSHEMSLSLVRSNGMAPALPAETNYKVFIGPGNNSQLVGMLVKRRWFWTRVEEWEQADFIWTQHRSRAIIQSLGTCKSTIRKREISLPALISSKKAANSLVSAERIKSGIGLITASPEYVMLAAVSAPNRVYNRIERNYQLTSKKRMFVNMRDYYSSRGQDVFSYLPLTFLLSEGVHDPEFTRFKDYFASISSKPKTHNLWIIKPGENTNCGNGIHVCSDLAEIEALIISTTRAKRSHIIQQYIEKPLLVNKRKFDIRCYGLITCFNAHTQGYFYHEGYLRTSSKEFSLRNIDNKFIHLTNDAVQKKSEDYGKFESGNKMSYAEFQRYLEAQFPGQVSFWSDIWPQIRELVKATFNACYHLLDPKHRQHTFEVLGYDFMIDDQFRVWLIEVNTNPCLELSSAYLAKLIPEMLDNAFRIAVDPYFPEPIGKRMTQWSSQLFQNKFELVFSSAQFEPEVQAPAALDQSNLSEDA